MLKDNTIYLIKDVPQNIPCENCNVCLRMRLMEMGITPGEKVKFVKHSKDMWIMSILSENNHEVSKLALRSDEFERIIFEELDCLIDL